ncbi:hypothetical protein IWQ61_009575 [Dispira simplex]|nr:hypothetical protein IWQ61_009575 [Dispira simplex]
MPLLPQIAPGETQPADERGVIDRCKRYIPVLKWGPHYVVKRDLPADLIAGLTVSTIVIPQSMAYAMLASNRGSHIGEIQELFPNVGGPYESLVL